MKKIDVKSLQDNVFSLIGDRWMLITAGTAERCNTMTASWGGLGVLWGRNVAACFIRPQRYTYEFMEASDWYTLSFFGPERRRELALCGAKSGREVDKVRECGFTVRAGAGNAPYFAEAELVLVCRKLFVQDMDPACVRDERIFASYGEKGGWHRIYTGEVYSYHAV